MREFNNKYLNNLDIKITMGRYLEIERELNVNMIEAQKDYQVLEAQIEHEKIRLQYIKHLDTMNKASDNDNLEKEKLQYKLIKLKSNIDTLNYAKALELLQLITKLDLSDEEEVTKEVLDEFLEYYNEEVERLFTPKTIEKDGDEEKK